MLDAQIQEAQQTIIPFWVKSMTKIADKPGRKISLNVIVDRPRSLVQVIRKLHNTKGFLVDSGHMGWIPIDEWTTFLEKELRRARGEETLMEQFGLLKESSTNSSGG